MEEQPVPVPTITTAAAAAAAPATGPSLPAKEGKTEMKETAAAAGVVPAANGAAAGAVVKKPTVAGETAATGCVGVGLRGFIGSGNACTYMSIHTQQRDNQRQGQGRQEEGRGRKGRRQRQQQRGVLPRRLARAGVRGHRGGGGGG